MMSRKFTTREKILLIICAVLMLGLFYYKVVWVDTADTIAASNTADLETEIMMQETMAAKKADMENEIKTNADSVIGEVATYNNFSNEMNELDKILAAADTYSLSFSEATLEGSTVRRNIDVVYHASTYQNMKSILQKLHDCKYRCLIGDVSITTTTSEASNIQTSSDLNVSLTITFYETTLDSETTAGLAQEEVPAAVTEEGAEGSTDETAAE